MLYKEQPWSPADATKYINEIASHKSCNIAITKHAGTRMRERGLIMSDLMFVLKNGFVYNEACESTAEGYYKYEVESQSPNSGSRVLRVVAIPDCRPFGVKIVTFMWRDD